MSVSGGITEEELQLFLEELDEQIQTLEDGFLTLEKGADPETVNALFRAAHTVKGSSAAVGQQQMTALTHAMENVLDRVRKNELEPTRALVDVLFKSLDGLRALRAAMIAGGDPAVDLGGTLALLRDAAAGGAGAGGGGADRATAPDLDEETREALREGEAAGAVPFKVAVSLAPDSIMPSVRHYQIYLALSDLGQVVKSTPTLEEIEAEKVGSDLVVYLLSREHREAVRAAAAAVTDVARVEVAHVETGAKAAEPAPAAPEAVPAAGAPAPAAMGAPSGAPAAAATPGAPGAGTPAPAAAAVPAAGAGGTAAAEARTVRVDVGVLDNLMNLAGELVIDRNRLGQLSTQLAAVEGVEELANEVSVISNHLSRLTGFLQDEILKARMVPVERLFKKFPRMIRDLSQRMGKEIAFAMEGENTELDRALIEVLGDPLIHLLRNAIDHGIEDPDARERAGKPRAGTVILAAYHRDNQIVVEVSDDGRGIDPARIREAAVRKGVLTPERAAELSDREATMLIFAPGFSTAQQVSDVSGRGVGMDVVRRNIESVNGRVEVDSQAGRGTAIRIHLPLTLATIRALLVRTADQTFALPLSAVVETLRVQPEEVQTANRQEVIVVRDKVVPLVRLSAALGIPEARAGRTAFYAVLVNAGGGVVFGLVVDSLLGEQEIVIKSLGRFIGNLSGLSGATVLGDGSLALILDVRGLNGAVWEERARQDRSRREDRPGPVRAAS